MKWVLPLLVFSTGFCADISYYELIEKFPETLGRHGSWKQGEIEIATSPAEIKRIEKQSIQRLIRKGCSKQQALEYSRVGIIAEDNYWMWVRDAVTFPGGIPGTYDRIVKKSSLSGPPGAVLLPILPNKKIVLNICFRHATRAWELELPRGMREEKETIKQAALRELREETGCITENFDLLGEMCIESGMISGTIPIYWSHVRAKRARHQNESEAIAKNVEMDVDEIKEAFKNGYVIIDIKGKKTKVYCRDPFLTYALLQAMWKGII